MKNLVLITLAVIGLSFSVQAQAKMSKKAAMKACKAEMPEASKADLKKCAKEKRKGS